MISLSSPKKGHYTITQNSGVKKPGLKRQEGKILIFSQSQMGSEFRQVVLPLWATEQTTSLYDKEAAPDDLLSLRKLPAAWVSDLSLNPGLCHERNVYTMNMLFSFSLCQVHQLKNRPPQCFPKCGRVIQDEFKRYLENFRRWPGTELNTESCHEKILFSSALP